MGACAGKHQRNDNESRQKHQKSDLGFSSSFKREKHQRLLNETIEQNDASLSTTLYDLPLEMLDTILEKSYLHWILNSPTKPRDVEVIRCLISVDVCFNRRITRRRFKKKIWRHLKDFYGKTKKRNAIIRNNRNYLLENNHSDEKFVASLLSLNCITQEQSHFIQLQRSIREKNDVLLHFVNYFDETKFVNFVKCLRYNNQKIVARILENGGGVIRIQVYTRGKNCTTLLETALGSRVLHQRFEDLRSRTKPRSHETDKLISQLKDEGVEILNSHLDRRTVVVWIWCHSQAALEYVQRLYESNQLRDVIFERILITKSVPKIIKIDRNQFNKTIVVCPLFISFSQRIEFGRLEKEDACGITKLGNEIYVLCGSQYYSMPGTLRVFEDRYPFRLQKAIEAKVITNPTDIGSSEKDNCLYVSDSIIERFIWKITRERDDEHKIIKWLTPDYRPHKLSVSTDGQLLVVSFIYSPSIPSIPSTLRIYDSDAELIRSIQLSSDIGRVIRAVETSIGNFIIIHEWKEWTEEK